MKKILEITISTIITGAILFGLLSIFIPFWICAYAYILVVPMIIVSFIIGEYLTIKNIKKAFLLVRYKRVKEVVEGECNKCVLFENNKHYDCLKSGRADFCYNSKTILANRSYNIFKWLKSLTILCIIAILSVSCVTINIYKTPIEQKTTLSDSTKTESWWF